ncbi:MAG: glycosyltransferase family 39 protein [Fimbriimonadales bacterium]|nr:glycosyltransferase family 39 protein [Fimbriimonadales bacterium]
MPQRAWTLAWIVALTPLLGFWTYGLFDLDEGIYAASLREMMERGDPFVITYGGAPFLEKPILVYWVAWGFHLLGVGGEVGLRLGSVLASIGTLAVSASFARRRFGDNAGLWTLLILGCSPLFAIVSKMFIPDALLVFFLTWGLTLFWDSTENARLRPLAAACLGFAMLAKGPVAPAIFVLLLVYLVWRVPSVRQGLKGGWVVSLLVFVAIVSLWYVPIALAKGGEFFREFILYQNLGRLVGADTAHRADFYAYIPVLIVALAPFIVAIVPAFRTLRSKPVEIFLWAWAIVIFVLFSAAGTKLPHYILPCLPPLAMILGRQISEATPSGWWALGWAFLLCAGSWTAYWLMGEYRDALLPLAAGATFGALLAFRASMRRAGLGATGLAAVWPVTVGAAVFGIPAYWGGGQKDAYESAKAAYSNGRDSVVEFRMEGLGARMATSQPSTYWYFGRPKATVFWIDELAAIIDPGDRILSRRGRLTNEHIGRLAQVGLAVERVGTWGEYDVYRVSARGHDSTSTLFQQL